MSISSSNSKTFVALAMAALLVTSGFAATAMAGSIDTSSTDATTTVSQVQDGDAIQHDANKSDAYTVQAIVANGTTPEMRIELNASKHSADGVVFDRNTSMEQVGSGVEGTHWNGTFTEGDLADVPIKVDGNRTIDIEVYNSSNNSDVLAEMQVTLVESGNRTVAYLGDVEVDENSDIETVADNKSILGFEYLTNDYSHVSDLDRKVNGSQTDVVVVFGNDTLAEDYSNAVSSDAEDGGWLVMQASALSGLPVKVYNEEAPDSVEEGDSYGVYQSDIGGQAGITYELGDASEGEDEITVNSYGNKDYSPMGLWDLQKAFGAWDATKASTFL